MASNPNVISAKKSDPKRFGGSQEKQIRSKCNFNKLL